MANGCNICGFGDDGYCEFCPAVDTRSPRTDPDSTVDLPVDGARESKPSGRIRAWFRRTSQTERVPLGPRSIPQRAINQATFLRPDGRMTWHPNHLPKSSSGSSIT